MSSPSWLVTRHKGKCFMLVLEKPLGIIGLGAIGKEVAKIARALEMRVVANDLVYDEEVLRQFTIEKAAKDVVVREADFLTLHVPYTPETERFIDRETIATMKRG